MFGGGSGLVHVWLSETLDVHVMAYRYYTLSLHALYLLATVRLAYFLSRMGPNSAPRSLSAEVLGSEDRCRAYTIVERQGERAAHFRIIDLFPGYGIGDGVLTTHYPSLSLVSCQAGGTRVAQNVPITLSELLIPWILRVEREPFLWFWVLAVCGWSQLGLDMAGTAWQRVRHRMAKSFLLG
ncbi:hypothetical protein VTK56DRAFT_9086 [Thermocarpiscus australiensis]